ncbi:MULTISPECIES: PH domain-containing protein [Curtobacterium]|uniref:PH domain-containing protein n=1 Tax=Curtobacterium poinsettiae TaxID=159612 RepID=A0ABT3S127_9MICO|nr:PH domain-containing protein [Curtobacterium flaccumfaciens]EYT66398.1 membrane protein [Curtobacterium flaccumfaciens UCD-AKU]MBT1609684.1 PH domain-containing protein [Curtobacterium flaccumfaciens pv. poinsettiae]MCU0152310.1 PH domain-containing protein [Curtobacterium flaccumfaciens pv. poinsettiae]MCX2848545.1 PH domain-containing protein [Curtobacterium flaccumfaciens pv. poinsettiae]MDQ0537536.1 putative membrane protein [Curtobacterium flaccumfaciens]
MTFRPGTPPPAPPAPPTGGNAAAAAPLTDGEWHRLHPLTPLLKGGIFLIVVLGYVLNSLRDQLVEFFIPGDQQEDGDPVRYVYEHGVVGWVLLGIVVLLLVLIGLFYLSWRMHEFRVTGEIVEVRSGVLFRNHRKARLDRIQGINIQRPLVPRVFGTAKLEIAQAGNDANVQLAYLGVRAADDLRQRILVLASGAKDDDGHGGPSRQSHGALQDRVDEMFSPELDPAAVHATRIVKVRPGRLIVSMLLSGTTLFLLLVIAGMIVSVALTGEFAVLFGLFPAVLGAGGYYVRKFSRSLQYTIAETRDGIRIGFGLVSTSNETLPPGRIHAVSVAQPLLWRPFGWWDIRINRATSAGNGASSNQQVSSIVLPVGTTADVREVLDIILPGLVGTVVAGPEASPEALREGAAEAVDVVDDSLTTSGDRGGFVHSPRRGAWLRPFAFRRNGYRFVQGAVLLRLGAVWRSLVIVPLPRVQSVKVEQGPLERALRVATVHVHTVAGPVSARIGALDARDAQRFWSETTQRAVDAAAVDTTHRWREREARPASATHAADAPWPGSGAPAGPAAAHRQDAAPPGPGWGDVPPTGAAR